MYLFAAGSGGGTEAAAHSIWGQGMAHCTTMHMLRSMTGLDGEGGGAETHEREGSNGGGGEDGGEHASRGLEGSGVHIGVHVRR